MPRKPKPPARQVLLVPVNGKQVTVYLHPPSGSRMTWYAYWQGLGNPKSTGQTTLEEATAAAQSMLTNGGKLETVADAVMSDEEFEAIQSAHFAKEQDHADRMRSHKTLKACLEAISAFKEITGLAKVSQATSDDCASFQREAMKKPKNWRQLHPKSKKEVACLSANTVLKWSRALQAAFERANQHAGKKCVRGVVKSNKLLTHNPWNEFEWAVDEVEKSIRQFSSQELISFLDFIEFGWPEITLAASLAKVYLWSACRQEEATGLRWNSRRIVDGECHFRIIGKWGVERWFRIPETLSQELAEAMTASPFVFAGYNDQLRLFHVRQGRPDRAAMVGTEFKPLCIGDWLYDRLAEWSAGQAGGHVSPHVFRKTSLQYARIGEEATLLVAEDACVSSSVVKKHYIKETDDLLRKRSNRTYQRILAGLPADIARRYGHVEASPSLERRVQEALAARNWPLAAALTAQLARQQASAGGQGAAM